MKSNSDNHPFLFVLFALLIMALWSPVGTSPARAADEPGGTGVSNELIKAHSTGGFSRAFEDLKEKVDGAVLQRVLDHAIVTRDDALMSGVVEAARTKGDEKALAAITLAAADYFLFISRYEDAMKLYDESIPAARKSEDAVLLGRAYEGNADAALYSGNAANALMMYERAADLFAKGGAHIRQGIVARKMADAMVQTGNYAEAAKMLQTSAAILSRQKDPREEAHVYRSYGDMAVKRLDQKAAKGYFEAALARYVSSRYVQGEADISCAFGDEAVRSRDFEKASELFRKACDIYDRTGSMIGKATCLRGQADAAAFTHRSAEARGLYEKALDVFTTARYPMGQADVLRRMGHLILTTGSVAGAVEIFKKALPLYQRLREPVGQADVYKGLADAAYQGGDFSRALGFYDKAMSSYASAGNPIGQGNVRRALGDINYYSDDDAGALEQYEKALSFFARQAIPQEQADTSFMMGRTYLKLGKNDHALAMFSSAMALYKKMNDPAGQGRIYLSLGRMYLDRGNRMGALDMYREALGQFGKLKSPAGQGRAHLGIGDVYLSAGDLGRALENYDTSLGLFRQIPDRELEGIVLIRKAAAQSRRKDAKEAAGFFEAGLERLGQGKTQVLFPDPTRALAEGLNEYFEEMVLFMIEQDQVEKAFEYVEALKMRQMVLALRKARAHPVKDIDPALRQERDSLENEITATGVLLAEEQRKSAPEKPAVEKLTNDLSIATQKLDGLIRDIRYKHPLYASVVYPQPLSVKSAQEKVLGENEVLADYFLSTKAAYCMLVTEKEVKAVKLPVETKELAPKIATFVAKIAAHGREPFPEALARQLYDILIKPIEPAGDDKTLIIAPHGALAYLPFEALMAQKDDVPQFMVQKYRLVLTQSAAVLGVVRSHGQGRSGTAFAGFGAPLYDGRSLTSKKETPPKDKDAGEALVKDAPQAEPGPGAVFLKHAWTRISGKTLSGPDGSEDEIEAVRAFHEKHGARAVSFLGAEAREERFLSPEMNEYSFIHIAVPCIARPGFQAVALSEAAGPDEEGFLTIGKLMNATLGGRLITLSSCDAGPVDKTGKEGVTVFTRAVMYAGSPAALVSLWTAPGEARREFMLRFYETLLDKGLSKVDALRAARLAFIETDKSAFSHPFFWSSFVLYGE